MEFFTLPLHPKLVHFPIALWVGAFILEILSLLFKSKNLHQSAMHVYILAALCTPLVIKTGLWEEERHQLNHPVLHRHELFALWTMWVSLISLPVLWVVRRWSPRFFRFIFAGFLIITVICVVTAGHYGGRLVYEYAIGVEPQ